MLAVIIDSCPLHERGSPMQQAKTHRSSKGASDYEHLSAHFKATATPMLRIALWLDQVEEKANAILRPLKKTLAHRRRDAAIALKEYKATRSTAEASDTAQNRRAARKALKAYIDAVNEIYPPLWQLANNALGNAALVRKNLAQGVADQAVEAALRTIHTAWELENKLLEKPLRAGLKGHASWSSGGRKRAEHVRAKLRGRNESIAQDRKAMEQVGGTSFAEIVAILSDRHGLSKKQIKRILEQTDTH